MGLKDSYCVARGLGDSQLGTFAAKIEAKRAIVGTKRLMDCTALEMKRRSALRDFPNLSNLRALSLRNFWDCEQGSVEMEID